MKLRAIHLAVRDLEAQILFWQRFLNATPKRNTETQVELRSPAGILNLIQNEAATPGAFLPAFECSDIEFGHYVDKARQLGAAEVAHLLNDPHRRSIVFTDPEGNEFEISRLHD